MTKDKRSRGPGSDAPGPDLRTERDEFLKKFSRGSQITEEFLKEHERMLSRLQDLESENAGLRAKVEADQAVRELLQKIERLEREKSELVSRYREAEATTTEFTARVQEVESEFANLANLFVASNQLHSSLSPRGVTRRIKEVLAQLVGAERYAMYLVNPEREELVPIASEGVPGDQLLPIRIVGTRIGEVLKKGSASVADSDPSQGTLQNPPAVIPLSVDDRVVGTIAIFSTLAQKNKFDTVDFELFKLLGQHAAQALVAASLFAQAEQKLPGLEAFLDLSV
ncbi:MAG TPA: GAF domain-containing protein [Polyangiaceae bacterium]|jgi:GAF domain-containing protein|nr:GAF domain-containing protein [Polyangiaceae bacterium]